jgi:acyl-CoA hydrolase
MDARPTAASQVTLVEWMGVEDANIGGFVHGGAVMKLCDEAAGIAAIKHSRCRVVTASVNAVWRTSMEVGVRVEAENPRTGEVRHTNSAYLTMVALDDAGRPLAVPPLATETPVQERRAREAQVRRANSLAERAQLKAERAAKG